MPGPPGVMFFTVHDGDRVRFYFILLETQMNILVRNIYVFEYFCILDTVFDVPILYYAKDHNCLQNITPLGGYRFLLAMLRNEDTYFFVLETDVGEKVYFARIEAHSTPYLVEIENKIV